MAAAGARAVRLGGPAPSGADVKNEAEEGLVFALQCADNGAAPCERHRFEIMGASFVVVGGCARARMGEDAAVHAQHMEAAIELMRDRGFLEIIAKCMAFTAEVFALTGDAAAATSFAS